MYGLYDPEENIWKELMYVQELGVIYHVMHSIWFGFDVWLYDRLTLSHFCIFLIVDQINESIQFLWDDAPKYSQVCSD